jgi:hypothetical protein
MNHPVESEDACQQANLLHTRRTVKLGERERERERERGREREGERQRQRSANLSAAKWHLTKNTFSADCHQFRARKGANLIFLFVFVSSASQH